MSLRDCLQKFGKALDSREADALQARVAELVNEGVSEAEAEQQAVSERVAAYESEMESIAQRAEDAGAEVRYEEGATLGQGRSATREDVESALKDRGVSGDDLLNALDLYEDLTEKGGQIDANGMATLYHRTTPENAERIKESGNMVSKEDRLFFGTQPYGQIEGYGDAFVAVQVPLENLELNDVFPSEAHVTMRSGRPGTRVPVTVLTQDATLEQVTESDAFKRWFGDSKVVDQNGDPLVVFHGTASDVTAFDVSRAGSMQYSDWGPGIYLTPSPSDADYYRSEAAKNTNPAAEAMWEQLEEMEKQATWENGSPNYPEGYRELLDEWRTLRAQAGREAGVVMPLYASIENPLVIEYQATPDPDLAQQAMERGHDGIFVLTPEGRLDEIVAFEPAQVKSAIGNRGTFDPRDPSIVAQEGDTEAPTRGSLTLLEDERILRLSEASDLSTFIHESAHLFLEMERVFAARYGLTEDQETILDWLGAESFDEVTANTERGREMHEKFAETFEVYAREGKAPSLRLRDAFAAFSRWLTQIYKRMVGDGRLRRADLNDDMREVFDRMLATQAEIEQAAAAAAYEPIFMSAEEAGMTEAQFAEYQAKSVKTRNRAEGDLYSQVVEQIRRRLTNEWKEEKAPLIEEERARLKQTPVYQIIDDLKTNKLDYEAVQDILGVEKMPGRLVGNARKGGVDPQEYAEIYGYASAKQMLRDVIEAPSLKEAADTAAQQRMIAKYGDMLNDGTIEDAAREAMQNNAYASRLVDELKALNRGQPVIDREALKAEAKAMIGQLSYKQIRPSKYYQAEIKAAQRAVTATTDAEQLEAKTQQLANHYLFREATDVKDRMVKNRRYVRRVQQRALSQGYTPSEVEPSFAQNMFTLANLYDLRQGEDRRRNVASLLEWYQAQVDDPNQFVNLELFDLQLIEALAARERGEFGEYTPPRFDELTADQLQSVVDMLKHLRYVGGRMADADKARRQAHIQRLAEWIRERGGKDVDRRMGEERKHEGLLRSLSHAYHRMSSARNLTRTLDGFTEDDAGLARDMIYTKLEDASNRKLELKEELRERFAQEMEGHYRLSISKAGRTDATIRTEDGRDWTLSSQARFMLAMYWGTESSREAIRQGYNVTDNDVMQMLSTLTPEQLRLVNATWKVNESLWPDLSASAVKTLGVAPPKLDPAPFTVNGVEMTGGHMRIFYDGVRQEMQTEDKENSNITSVTPSRAGSTYARIGSGGKPVQLEITNLQRAWDDAIHAIAFAEPAREIASVLNVEDVRRAIVDKHGESFYQALIETTQGITRNQKHRELAPFISSVMNITRRALVAKYLMYSPRNVAQQVTALPIISNDVGNATYVESAFRIAANRDLIETIRQKSSFMRNRTQLVNREASEELKKISVDSRFGHIYQQFAAMGFTPQTVVDATLAYPGWLAKYEKGIDEHGDEKRAISDADTLVAESVGSGSDLHLGGWFQSNNPEWIKAMTMMGSWMQMLYQRILRSSRGFSEVNRRVVRDAAVLPLMIGVIEAAVVLDIPDDLLDDPDNLLAWMAKKYGGTLGGILPIVRDLVSAIEGFEPSSPYAAGVTGTARVFQELEQLASGDQGFGQFAMDITKHTATAIVPIPGSGTILRFAEYWQSWAQGNEGRAFNPYQALIEGEDRND